MSTTLAVIVCGSRNWTDAEVIRADLDRLTQRYEDILVIEGGAPGADRIAGEWCEVGAVLPCRLVLHQQIPADWEKHGKAAGPIRNQQMLERLLRFQEEGWDVAVWAYPLPDSRGTKDMINRAWGAGVPVWVLGERTGYMDD